MKISDVIRQLENIKEKEGDLEVRIQSISHTFPPEIHVRQAALTKFVILNN